MKNTNDTLLGSLILQNNGNSSGFWKPTTNLSEEQVKKATSIVSMRLMNSSDNTNIFSVDRLHYSIIATYFMILTNNSSSPYKSLFRKLFQFPEVAQH